METNITAETITQRIRELGLTKTAAAGMLDMTPQNLNKHLRSKPLSQHFLRLFRERIGVETKVENEETKVSEPEPAKYNEAKFIDTSKLHIMWVPLVTESAYAGYPRGCNNPQYLSQLEQIPWLVNRQYKGNYLSFEVSGDSMDDGSSRSYLHGDRVLCREVAPHLWQASKLHIRDWVFVVVHRTEGVIIKQVKDHDVPAGKLYLHSYNPLYEDYVIDISDVLKIFNVVQVLRNKV